MDSTDPDILFDENGICNHCREFSLFKSYIHISDNESKSRLDKLANAIIIKGGKKEYNCLLGLSGGVDSSYVAHLAGEMGLRPLTVHFDNGWNSELAVGNIHKLVDKLGFDLITNVIDWDEFRDLQRSFLYASVIDIELLTDHAIAASLVKIARQRKIHYILSGNNKATEYGMPKAWCWNKQDAKNIKSIQKRFGTKKIKSFPILSSLSWIVLKYLKVFEFIEPLNQINYRKDRALDILKNEYGWVYYGGKHYESIFTKFYQAYILPKKFNADKRKAHLSSLIRNNEITREEALHQLGKPLYDPVELENDKEYVIKKLGFSADLFEDLMNLRPCPHNYYASDERLIRMLEPLKRRYYKQINY